MSHNRVTSPEKEEILFEELITKICGQNITIWDIPASRIELYNYNINIIIFINFKEIPENLSSISQPKWNK